MTDVKPSGLIKKLVEVMQSVDRIPKNGWNDFHKYHYALEADILEALRGELAQRNVLILPAVTGRSRDAVGEKGQVVTHLDMEFTFYDAETGESVTRPWLGAGADKEDKGAYKAMTGGEKYFLLKTFLIPTGDDPEAEGQQQPPPRRESPPRQQPRQQPSPPPQSDGSGVLVTNVKVAKKGSSAKGPWTLYAVAFSDNSEATTFSESIAKAAQRAKQESQRVEVVMDGKNIAELRPCA